jgi:hypothetical protein
MAMLPEVAGEHGMGMGYCKAISHPFSSASCHSNVQTGFQKQWPLIICSLETQTLHIFSFLNWILKSDVMLKKACILRHSGFLCLNCFTLRKQHNGDLELGQVSIFFFIFLLMRLFYMPFQMPE